MAEAVRGAADPGRPELTRGRGIRIVWAACLVLAGLNHALILLRHGLFWNYGGVGTASAAYWTSLTIVDPLVAMLLLVKPRAGVPAAAAVIATNVAHNLFVTGRAVPGGELLRVVLTTPQLLAQIGFLLFVIGTYRLARSDLRVDGPRI